MNLVSLDTLINHVIYNVNNIFIKKHYPDSLLDNLYLIVTSMILEYGDSSIPRIYEVLENIEFFDGSLFNYQYRVNKRVDFNKKFNVKYEVLYYDFDKSPLKELESLTYSLNSIYNSLNYNNTFKISFNGLFNGFNYTSKESIIEKIFNLLRSEEVIKNIFNFKNLEISNARFIKAFSKFNSFDSLNYTIEGINVLTNLFRPLLNSKEVRKIIFSNNIESDFDEVLGKNSFKKVSQYVENLYVKINDVDSYYNISISYLNIRNNYINKYLGLKFA